MGGWIYGQRSMLYRWVGLGVGCVKKMWMGDKVHIMDGEGGMNWPVMWMFGLEGRQAGLAC